MYSQIASADVSMVAKVIDSGFVPVSLIKNSFFELISMFSEPALSRYASLRFCIFVLHAVWTDMHFHDITKQ